MRILITGGAGYVGSLLVPELLEENHSIVVLDWFLFKPDLFSEIKSDRLKLIKGDVRDNKVVISSLKDIDAVIHLAAISNDPSSDLNPQITKEINFTATINLAKLAKKHLIKKFIFASSASVYGIQDKPSTEKTFPRPLTIYSKTKLEAETYVLGLNDNNFTVTSVRPATLSGFAPRMRLDLVVNNMTAYAYINNSIKVNGGEQYRPNLSVKDMVRVYKQLINCENNKIAGQIFNVCQSNLKISDIALCLKQTLGPKIKIEYFPSNDKRSYWLESDKIKKIIGFTPKFSLKDSIRDVLLALKENIINPKDPFCRNVDILKTIDLKKNIMP